MTAFRRVYASASSFRPTYNFSHLSRSGSLLAKIAAVVVILAISVCSVGRAQLQVLHNHVRREVSSGQAPLIGSMPSDQRLNFSIVLPLRNQAELTGLLNRLYDPASPDYRQFLSVDEFTERFGPTVEDYQTVVAFAQASGFSVTAAPANRVVVPLSGTVDQVNRAFNIRMNSYRHPTENRNFYSPDREPSLNLSVPVARISGLSSFSLPHPMVIPPRQQQAELANVTGSGPGGSYLASDMRAAYYGAGTLNGNGQAVGLLEFDGYDLSDVNSTFSTAGQTYNVAINNVLLDGATGAPTSGAEAEVVLDIVQAIGMAPGLSQVRVYIGQGQDDANILNSMATENIAKQISSSWSWQPDDPQTDDVFLQEFAAQGQSFFDASGDEGAWDAAISPYFYPAEDAWVTAVGGTHLTTSGAGGSWASEVAWNYPPYGSGGGISPDDIAIPSWQSGVANTSNEGSATLRNVPDVAMEGDFDNYLCSLGSCSGGWAGTSFAAPRWAGFMALVNQQAVEAGNAPAGGVGFLNPSLYALAQGNGYANDLHDITSGNNDTENQPVWFSAVTGYDLVTGWGSPTGPSLIDDLAGPQVPGFWIIGSPAVVSVNQGASSSTTISVSAAGGFTGNVTLAVTSTLPTGVTASWGTNPTSESSVLTLTASSSAPTSTTPITITGTSGNLTSSAAVTVAVHAPTFALSASPFTLGINPGSSGTSTITVNPEYGFTGSVNLSISGLPTGVTASFSPTSTTGTSTLTLNVASTAPGGTSTLTITGTSGNLTVTTTFLLTVQAPTFQISTSATLDIGQGATASAYLYVFPEYGFTGSVNLSVSGLPSGVTASISPNPAPIAGSTVYCILTLTASASASLGTSTLTITGTSGNITETATLALTVHQPTFTISAYNVDVGEGSSANTYVYVDGLYGFSGNVTFSVTGLPSGVTALWNPNPAASYTNLTLNVSGSAAPGPSTLTITGTSGSITATTTLVLTVHTPSFTLSSGGTVNMGQGTTASTYLYVNPQYGFTGNVTLAASGLPSGVTASFSPNPGSGYVALTLTATSSAPVGNSTITITGTSGALTATTTFSLGIFAPTFTISGYGSATIGQGTSTTTYLYVYPEYGSSSSVTFSVSGLPTGVTASFSPNPTTTTSSVLTLTASSTATLGQYTLTITGTSGQQSATTTLALGVYQPTFTISTYTAPTMGQGTSTTAYVYINQQYGFTGNVTLSVSGLPSGVTASFSPNPGTTYTLLSLNASSTATPGQYTLTITGTSGALTASTTMSLGVYAPLFYIEAGSIGMGQGATASTYLYIEPEYGFSGNVTFSVSGLPGGVTASFSPNPTTYSSTMTVTTSSTAALGQYTLTIIGTSGSLIETGTAYLTIYPQSFTLTSYFYSTSMNPGSSVSGSVYVYPQYGFTGAVNLAVSGLPAGVTATFSPNPTTDISDMTLVVSPTAPPGTSTVTLSGTSGTLHASVTFYLSINQPGFTLTGAPGEVKLIPGGSGESLVAVIPQNGFAANVSLAATGLPTGVSATFSPNPTGSGLSTLSLSAGSTAPQGSATVTITGTAGSLSASTSVLVTVKPAPPTVTSTTLQITSGGASVQSVSAGTAVTLSAAVTANSTTINTGQVNFCDTSAIYCGPTHNIGMAQLTSGGTATLKFMPPMGVHSYKAVFVGTSSDATSASSSSTLTVTASQPTITTITQSGNPGEYTLTATVTGRGLVAPSGTVSFLDTTNNNTVVGAAALANPSVSLGWSNPQSPASGYDPYSIAVGDFNGDGIPDIAIANSENNTLTILLGNGDGTFTATATSPQTGTYPYAVAVGDFNRDGKLDLAVANASGDNVTILLGNGDGTFAPLASRLATGYDPEALAVGDFNGDGILDLAILNSGSDTVTVQLGNGDGTFTPASLTAQTGSEPQQLVMGDFNGDGILDLATLNYGNGTVTVLLGNGDGSFTAAPTPAAGQYPNALAAADFNDDGKLDLAIANYSGNNLTILLGHGDGTFTASTASLSSVNYPTALAAADFNGDGITDLAVINDSTTAGILLGNGDGTFAPMMAVAVPAGSAVATGDFYGSGTADLAVANYDTVTILTSQLTQTVSAIATGVSPIGSGIHQVESSYPGDTRYKSSISATTGLTAELVTPTVTVSSSPAGIIAGQALPVTVSVAGGAGNPTPTGSVTLISGTYTSAAGTLSAGAATINIPGGSLAAGSDTLTATYTPDLPGSSSYNSSNGSATEMVTAYSVWVVDGSGGSSELNSGGGGMTSGANPGANTALVVDNSGNVWTIGSGTPPLEEATLTGAVQNQIAAGTGGLDLPAAIAIDGDNRVWVANGNNSVSLFSNAGAALSPSSGFTSSSLQTPSGIAIDVSGSVWIANKGNNSVTRVLGGAAPAAPLATSVANNTTGAKP